MSQGRSSPVSAIVGDLSDAERLLEGTQLAPETPRLRDAIGVCLCGYAARRAAGGPPEAEPAADAGPAAPQAPPCPSAVQFGNASLGKDERFHEQADESAMR